MGLGESEYPAPGSRPSITASQWIQYQLDNFSTVEEVITSDSLLRISHNDSMPYHFLVCDSMGNCATIEFIGGGLVYHTRETMPVKVLTNITYAECIEYWEQDEIPTPDYAVSVKRFITAADMLTNYDPETSGSAIDYAFNILSNVTWYIPTQCSIVYDIQNLRIYFHTLENGQIRHIDLSSFDFPCKAPVKDLTIKMIRFEDPWLLVILIIIPLMILYQHKGLGRSRLRFSSLDNLKALKKSPSLFLRHILSVLRYLTIALFVIALARPQSGTKTKEVLTEGVDIILCLDTSGSMQAADFNWMDDL